MATVNLKILSFTSVGISLASCLPCLCARWQSDHWLRDSQGKSHLSRLRSCTSLGSCSFNGALCSRMSTPVTERNLIQLGHYPLLLLLSSSYSLKCFGYSLYFFINRTLCKVQYGLFFRVLILSWWFEKTNWSICNSELVFHVCTWGLHSKLQAMAVGSARLHTHNKFLDFMCILEDFCLDNFICGNLMVKVYRGN